MNIGDTVRVVSFIDSDWRRRSQSLYLGAIGHIRSVVVYKTRAVGATELMLNGYGCSFRIEFAGDVCIDFKPCELEMVAKA